MGDQFEWWKVTWSWELVTSTTDEGTSLNSALGSSDTVRLSSSSRGISPGGTKLAAVSPSTVDSVVKAPVVEGLDSIANDGAAWLVVVLGRFRLTGSDYFPTIS